MLNGVNALAAGLYAVEIGTAGGPMLYAGPWNVVAESLNQLHDANAARLAAVEAGTPQLRQALSAALARNDLTVKEAEKQLIIRALKETRGNRTLAAKKIGMSRRTFHRKLHLYHLEGF